MQNLRGYSPAIPASSAKDPLPLSTDPDCSEAFLWLAIARFYHLRDAEWKESEGKRKGSVWMKSQPIEGVEVSAGCADGRIWLKTGS